MWVKSCKCWNELEYQLTTDGWLWYSLPDNTQEPGDIHCYMIMLLWGVFWDGVFDMPEVTKCTIITYSVAICIICPLAGRPIHDSIPELTNVSLITIVVCLHTVVYYCNTWYGNKHKLEFAFIKVGLLFINQHIRTIVYGNGLSRACRMCQFTNISPSDTRSRWPLVISARWWSTFEKRNLSRNFGLPFLQKWVYEKKMNLAARIASLQ